MTHCDDCAKPCIASRFRYTTTGGTRCDNCRRIRNARRALKPYRDHDDLKSPVIDLLADLAHYCLKHDLDFTDLVRVAADHVQVEISTEGA